MALAAFSFLRASLSAFQLARSNSEPGVGPSRGSRPRISYTWGDQMVFCVATSHSPISHAPDALRFS